MSTLPLHAGMPSHKKHSITGFTYSNVLNNRTSLNKAKKYRRVNMRNNSFNDNGRYVTTVDYSASPLGLCALTI